MTADLGKHLTFRAGAQVSVLIGPVIAAALILAGAASAQTPAASVAGDPAVGVKLFLQCRACHTVGSADPSGVGPNLYGVMGAKAAARPGYTYSPALKAAGLTWTPETMDAWLKRPTAVVPDTKMATAGVADAQMRRNLIAYLQTLGPKTVAVAGAR